MIAFLLTGACAPKNWNTAENGPFDPWEDVNRGVYRFNKDVDALILKPVAEVYVDFPTFLKNGFDNAWENAQEPANAVNSVFQKKGDAAVNATARFTFNTLFGLGGLFDIAKTMGIQREKADFGQTLRAYGFSDTAYFVLPILGPTTFADRVGGTVDSYGSSYTYIDDEGARVAVYGVAGLQKRTELLETTDLITETALDEYSFVRDAYEEHRRSRVPTEVWGR